MGDGDRERDWGVRGGANHVIFVKADRELKMGITANLQSAHWKDAWLSFAPDMLPFVISESDKKTPWTDYTLYPLSYSMQWSSSTESLPDIDELYSSYIL